MRRQTLFSARYTYELGARDAIALTRLREEVESKRDGSERIQKSRQHAVTKLGIEKILGFQKGAVLRSIGAIEIPD
jgi:hypothetical protein